MRFMSSLVIAILFCLCFGEVSSGSAPDREKSSSRTMAPRPPNSPGSVARDSNRQVVANILKDIQSMQTNSIVDDRPFVTLTFAQSLDGKIAYKHHGSETSSNLPLSGKESLLLTHGLRSIHDAILVGGKTLSTDNPRLSNRLWGDAQPRPVVLDPNLDHVRALGSSQKARNAIVCCSYEAALLHENDDENDYESSLQVMPCQCDAYGRLILRDVLQRLRERFRIQSIMVEGGASVHSSFLSERLVDCLCVTIAPKILGNDRGLACFSSIKQANRKTRQQFINLASAGSEVSRFVPLGNDCIYLCQWPRDKVS